MNGGKLAMDLPMTWSGTPEEQRRQALCYETEQINLKATVFSRIYRIEWQVWRRVNTALVTLAAVLAALSGGAGLGNLTNRTVVGLLALSAAVVAAIAASLGADKRASSAQAAATLNMRLADRAKKLYVTRFPCVALDEAVSEFEKLFEEHERVVAASPTSYLPWHHRRYRSLVKDAEKSLRERPALNNPEPGAPPPPS